MRGSTQMKVHIRKWAEDNNLWKQFVDIRERMKKDGVPAGEAWMQAAQELDPEMWGKGELSEIPVDPPVLKDLPRGRSEEVKVERVVSGGGATKAVFAGKKVATVKVVEWVASNMQVEDVSPSDAPSSEAWGMLVWARRSPLNESQFWGSIYAKLLPSRSAIEQEQRYSDDGMRVEDAAERLLRMKEEAERPKER
jgi:hypothetical protein